MVDREGEHERAVRSLLERLRGVPLPLAHVVRGRRGKTNAHLGLFRSPVHTEVAAGQTAEVEPVGQAEPLAPFAHLGHAGQAEGADGVAQVAVADQVPVALETHPVIRVDQAPGSLTARTAVEDLQPGGGAQAVEHRGQHLGQDDRGERREHGEPVLAAGPGQGAVGQGVFDLAEHRAQAVVDGRALVLGEQLVGQVDGEQVRFADVHGRQLELLLGVVKAALPGRILQRCIQFKAHVFDIALNGLGADFVFGGQ